MRKKFPSSGFIVKNVKNLHALQQIEAE